MRWRMHFLIDVHYVFLSPYLIQTCFLYIATIILLNELIETLCKWKNEWRSIFYLMHPWYSDDVREILHYLVFINDAFITYSHYAECICNYSQGLWFECDVSPVQIINFCAIPTGWCQWSHHGHTWEQLVSDILTWIVINLLFTIDNTSFLLHTAWYLWFFTGINMEFLGIKRG